MPSLPCTYGLPKKVQQAPYVHETCAYCPHTKNLPPSSGPNATILPQKGNDHQISPQQNVTKEA